MKNNILIAEQYRQNNILSIETFATITNQEPCLWENCIKITLLQLRMTKNKIFYYLM